MGMGMRKRQSSPPQCPQFGHLPSSVRSPAWQSEQKRFLNIHEYQGAELMASYGINVPRGIPVTSLNQVAAAADSLAGDEVVVKSQILAGGRGLGKFTSGFQGGVHLVQKDKAVDVASKMLGGTLVTKQTGEAGQPVSMVLVNEGLEIESEKYFAILMDRAYNGPCMVASSEGGMDIEEVAETNPDAIVTEAIDIFAGVQPEQTERLARAMGFREENIPEAQAR